MSEQRRVVGVAHAIVAEPGETLVTLGLGSCVAVLLHDPVGGIAGMAHVLLPGPPAGDQRVERPAKFATTAVPHLIAEMERRGADRSRLVARLVGGASMFGALLSAGTLHTGQRNIAAARQALQDARVPIRGEEVGQEHGRSVFFHAATGRVRVTSALHPEVEL